MGAGLVDVRAAEVEAGENGSRSAEMELELLAKDPSGSQQRNRDAASACWQLSVGHHGPPGPPGGHGHYVFEQVEDLEHVTHGETCGTVILRITVIDPQVGAGVVAHPPVSPPSASPRLAYGAQVPVGMPAPVPMGPPAYDALPM